MEADAEVEVPQKLQKPKASLRCDFDFSLLLQVFFFLRRTLLLGRMALLRLASLRSHSIMTGSS